MLLLNWKLLLLVTSLTVSIKTKLIQLILYQAIACALLLTCGIVDHLDNAFGITIDFPVIEWPHTNGHFNG